MKEISPRIILYLGVLATTTSSFIIRFANQDAYLLAATRVIITGILSLLVSTRFKYPKLRLSAREIILIIISGISLASHFAWWFVSLDLIPIGTSLALTNTAPVWLLVISVIIFKKIPSVKDIIAIILVIIGVMILFFNGNTEVLVVQGLFYALSSAVGFAIYLIIAKLLVNIVGLWRYFGIVNLIAGITLLIVTLLSGKSLISGDLWLYGIILALIPGMMGHASYNWAMSKIEQVDVAVATLGEPLMGTILAVLIFAEFLSIKEIFGMIFLLSAIIMTLVSRSDDVVTTPE